MRSKLLASLNTRLKTEVSKKNPVYLLNSYLPLDTVIDNVISTVFLYTREKKGSTKALLMTETVCAIGNSLMGSWRLEKNSSVAAKLGAFFLYSFEELGMLKVKLGVGTGKHQTYIIEVLDEASLAVLWESISIERATKLPSLTPYADWTSSRHATGISLVKTMSKEVLDALTPESQPMVFECVNRAQKIGWVVNKEIYNVYLWALRDKTEAFADIWEMQSQEAKASKVREAVTIGSIAKKFLNDVFYHAYTFDFRSRRYVVGAYFHEQSTDLAKSFLLYHKKTPITKRGYYWLLISIASNWAGASDRADKAKTDKLPLRDRVYWALDHEDDFIKYATEPKKYQGWMKAEKCWQFLAACIELNNLRNWQRTLIKPKLEEELYQYESGLVVYVDGSNNGSQHLAALCRDEVTAPFVNLLPSPEPGDLYKYVADHVWTKIAKDVETLDGTETLEELISDIVAMKSEIASTPPKSPERAEMIAEMSLFRALHRDNIRKAAPIYWNRISDSKEKRKVCKRGTMTLALN